MKYNLHVIGFPHTAESKEYGQCAYTQKTRKFLKMFPSSYHYGNEGSDKIANFVQIFSKQDQQRLFGQQDWFINKQWYKHKFTAQNWAEFNGKVAVEIARRIKPNDLILMMTSASELVSKFFPQNKTVEYGVGYEKVFADYKVFESYAWMHTIYGWKMGASKAFGNCKDVVIPNYFDPEEFEQEERYGSYLLWMNRPIYPKGIDIAKTLAKETGIKLVVAGAEEVKGQNIEYVGIADSEFRKELLKNALAVLMPTQYIEPFGGVHIEGMFCGTPAITSDYGAFTEYNIQGKTGYRCKTMREYIQAVDKVKYLDREEIYQYAMNNFSLEAIKPKFQRYFDWIQELGDKNWTNVF